MDINIIFILTVILTVLTFLSICLPVLPRDQLFCWRSQNSMKIKKYLNKNLVYNKAEPWAKQNIELLFEDVYDWAIKSMEAIDFELADEKAIRTWFGGNWKNKNINLIFLYYFQNFKNHLFEPNSVGEVSDAEFMEILIKDINLIAHRINSAGGDADPEQIIPRVKSLFWSC